MADGFLRLYLYRRIYNSAVLNVQPDIPPLPRETLAEAHANALA